MKTSSVIAHAHKVHAEEVRIKHQVPASIAVHVTAVGRDNRELEGWMGWLAFFYMGPKNLNSGLHVASSLIH